MTSTETPANNRKRDLPLTSPEDSEECTWKIQQDKRSNNSKKIKTNEDINKNIEDLRNNSKTHVIEPTKKTSAPSKSIIKLIIQKHNFEDEKINKNYFNQNITNFPCISVKKSYKNNFIICEIPLELLNEPLLDESWKITKPSLIIDKKSQHLKSLCANRIYDDEGTIIDMYKIKEKLKVKTKIFNMRKEGNLYVFEVLRENSISLNETNIELEDLKHTIRTYDPLDNYVIQCRKCHKYGHLINDCKIKKNLRSWCGGADCNRQTM